MSGACDATVRAAGRRAGKVWEAWLWAGSKVFLRFDKAGQSTCTQIQIKCFPERPRKEKVWSVHLGRGGSVAGASRARRPGCSGSPSCEAGHRHPLRVSVCKHRLGHVTMSSAAPLEGPAQPCLQTEEEWTKIKDICKSGTADTQGSLV